jgi:H+/Cl- antiporter ClcA
MIPVVFVSNGMNGHSPFAGSLVHVPDYTIWSIFSTLCCGFLFGLCALWMSLKARSDKRNGDLQSAKDASKWAAILNVVAIVSSILAVLIYLLYYNRQF